jgi:hypothetical protein
MLDGVLDTIPNDLRGSLGKEWKDVKDMCLDIVDEKTPSGRDVLGKPLHLRASTPVLSMVAVDLVFEIEWFIKTLRMWDIYNDGGRGGKVATTLREVWAKVVEIIEYFRLPVHTDSHYIEGDGIC